MTDDIRKLIGGYATGTLSDEERKALFQAALEDEELFAALADEQALKELLDDPAARTELLQATETRSKRSIWAWLAPAGALSLALLVAVVGLRIYHQKPEEVKTAQVSTPAAVATAPAPVPAPATVDQPPPAPVRRAEPQKRIAETKPSQSAERPAPAAGAMPVRDEPAIAAPAPAPPAQAEARKSEVTSALVVQNKSTADTARPAAIYKEKVPDTPATYTLLKKSESGEFVAVPDGSIFSRTDEIRVKVRATGPALIALFQGPRLIANESTHTAGDYILPKQGGIALTAGTSLELRFSQPPQPLSQAFTPGARAVSERQGPVGTIRISVRTE